MDDRRVSGRGRLMPLGAPRPAVRHRSRSQSAAPWRPMSWACLRSSALATSSRAIGGRSVPRCMAPGCAGSSGATAARATVAPRRPGRTSGTSGTSGRAGRAVILLGPGSTPASISLSVSRRITDRGSAAAAIVTSLRVVDVPLTGRGTCSRFIAGAASRGDDSRGATGSSTDASGAAMTGGTARSGWGGSSDAGSPAAGVADGGSKRIRTLGRSVDAAIDRAARWPRKSLTAASRERRSAAPP